MCNYLFLLFRTSSLPARWHLHHCWWAAPDTAPRWRRQQPGAAACCRGGWADWCWHHSSPAQWPPCPAPCDRPYGALCSQKRWVHQSERRWGRKTTDEYKMKRIWWFESMRNLFGCPRNIEGVLSVQRWVIVLMIPGGISKETEKRCEINLACSKGETAAWYILVLPYTPAK